MIINIKQELILILTAFFLVACSGQKNPINKQIWGQIENDTVYLYSISNTNGMTVKITNYGGIITSIMAPDKNGKIDDVVLGFDNLKQYLEPHPSFGCIVGRVANWIENAEFKIDSTTYKLASVSGGKDMLHGNNEFDCAVWDSKIIQNKYGHGIQLYYKSKDGSNGFPGNLDTFVTYTLSNNNELRVTYEATTDKATHVNLTQHSYFNLSSTDETIYNHIVEIDAIEYIKHDKTAKPSRYIDLLEGRTWDLSKPTRLGDRIHDVPPNGYALCYVLNKPLNKFEQVAKVIEPISGRTLTVSTTQPGLVFYTGNYLDGNLIGKNNTKYVQHGGLCLETQHYPDAPNQKDFPSTILRPGEKYKEVAIYRFGVLP